MTSLSHIQQQNRAHALQDSADSLNRMAWVGGGAAAFYLAMTPPTWSSLPAAFAAVAAVGAYVWSAQRDRQAKQAFEILSQPPAQSSGFVNNASTPTSSFLPQPDKAEELMEKARQCERGALTLNLAYIGGFMVTSGTTASMINGSRPLFVTSMALGGAALCAISLVRMKLLAPWYERKARQQVANVDSPHSPVP